MKDDNTETHARNIIKRLRMFNRKERDHFMKFALCEKPEAPPISTALWKKISNGGTKPNPDAMFIGMDYHLNWLYAALATSGDEDLDKKFDNSWTCELPAGKIRKKNEAPIQDNQQDMDLLVAWFDQRWAKPLRLVLIEAKLDSKWGPEQIESKLERLTLIREDSLKRTLDFIDWQFILMSPVKPSKTVFAELLKVDRYSWAHERATEGQGFRHETLERPEGSLFVNRVSGNWSRWKVKGASNEADDQGL